MEFLFAKFPGEENLRLKRAIDELSILNDLAQVLAGPRTRQDVVEAIVQYSLRAVPAEGSFVTLVGDVGTSAPTPLDGNAELLRWMLSHPQPLVINREDGEGPLVGLRWAASIRTLICVPLLAKSGLRGMLTVYNKKDSGNFSIDDQRLLTIIAEQSAEALDHARRQEEEGAMGGIHDEVRLAAKIQFDLLAKTPPSISGYQIACRTVPAYVVGGDYYDFISIDDGRLFLVV